MADNDHDEWSADANKAVIISLVQASDASSPKSIANFHPQFTYPIFGEAQTIFGYQGLRINLRFAAHDLRPSYDARWEKKYTPVGETKALELKETLEDWLPSSAFDPPLKYDQTIQDDTSARDFKPPGEKLLTYALKGKTYEVWEGRLTDPAVQQILQRMQIFIPLFIEGGTYLNLDDPEWSLQRWRIYFLYEVSQIPTPSPNISPYTIVGYCTTYRYYLFLPPTTSTPSTLPSPLSFPPLDPSTLPSRLRISQFLILPPHQSRGHGSLFYTSLYSTFLLDASIHEVTVEDPNESFDDLRDYADLAYLRAHHPAFTALRINPTPPVPNSARVPTAQLLDLPTLDGLRRATKIAPRQFARLVEMQLLSTVPDKYRQAARLSRKHDDSDDHDRMYERWRLLVKQRLYKFNREQLAQLERRERLEKLEEVLGGVEADYLRLLRGVEERDDKGERKRKIGEDGDAAVEAEGSERQAKKPKHATDAS